MSADSELQKARTLVVQSFRTEDVPAWLSICMNSVRAWADSCRFDYEFVDDALFSYLPEWYTKTQSAFYPATDLARLHLLADRQQRYERVVWMDADILLFAPDRLCIDEIDGYAFCFERMLWIDGPGRYRPGDRGVNNAVMFFSREHPMLRFYIEAAKDLLMHIGKSPARTAIGPDFLTGLGKAMPLRLIENIGLLSPGILSPIASGDPSLSRIYREIFGNPLAGANLCHFMRNHTHASDRPLFDAMYLRAVEGLLASPEFFVG